MNASALASLRDLHLPPPPGPWPLAPGWWGLGVVVLALVAVVLWRRQRRLRPLRAALAELAALSAAHRRDHDALALARGLSRLLRSYAVQRYPHAAIAGATGPDWLGFLDAHGGGGAFSAGAGAVLATLPYRAAPPTMSDSVRELAADPGADPRSAPAFDPAVLLALVRRWLEVNAP